MNQLIKTGDVFMEASKLRNQGEQEEPNYKYYKQSRRIKCCKFRKGKI